MSGGSLVKTIRFDAPRYVGDPLNAVRLFNEFAADELVLLDIEATKCNSEPNYDLIRRIAVECRMPLCYGGGIKSVDQAVRLVSLGVEKIAIGSAVFSGQLIRDISNQIGRQSICAIINVRTEGTKSEYRAVVDSKSAELDPFDLARRLQEMGAGEILVNSIDRDGVMCGYDLELARRMRDVVSTPLTMLGGAGSIADMQSLINTIGVCGAAAGSLFVFRGRFRAVLISYDKPRSLY